MFKDTHNTHLYPWNINIIHKNIEKTYRSEKNPQSKKFKSNMKILEKLCILCS